jgi:glutamate-1-semialdehyde 2,1-aminomutase
VLSRSENIHCGNAIAQIPHNPDRSPAKYIQRDCSGKTSDRDRPREVSMTARPARSVIPGNSLGMLKLPDDLSFVVARGQGTTLWTTDGRQFTDFVLGSGPMMIGHAHPRVVAAIQEQATRGTTFYTMNEMALRLAARIVDLVPCAESVKFASDGAEATFYSLRLARAFTGRPLVLKFDGGYHGHHDYALHRGNAAQQASRGSALPTSAGIPGGLSETILIAPFNDLEATTKLVEPVRDQLAAIIVEPIQRALLPKPGFLAGLRVLCDRIGALLVFDEVVTGFRVAIGGAQALYGVTPDLCSLGKIIGGGLPLSAIAGRHDILELTVSDRAADGRSVYFNGTLNGNAIAAAAGLATLDVIEEEDAPAKLVKTGNALMDQFRDAARKSSVPLQMIGPPAFCEPVFGAGDVCDFASYSATNRVAAKQFGIELIKRGFFVHPASKMYLSSAHSEAQIEAAGRAAFAAMRAVRDAGLV